MRGHPRSSFPIKVSSSACRTESRLDSHSNVVYRDVIFQETSSPEGRLDSHSNVVYRDVIFMDTVGIPRPVIEAATGLPHRDRDRPDKFGNLNALLDS
jgi:hypothetical protein